MSYVAVTGPIVTGGDVEAAVVDVLKLWLPSYICQAERAHGLEVGSTPWPRGWTITGRGLDKLVADQLPCVVIMAGGITNPPRKEGGPGVYTATWGVDVGTVFNAAWGRSSRSHAQLYAASIRLLLTQRPLTIPASVDWRGEAYDEMDFATERSYSASVCSFNVEVRDVAWANGGPPPFVAPPQDPTEAWDDWVQVTSAEVTVNNIAP